MTRFDPRSRGGWRAWFVIVLLAVSASSGRTLLAAGAPHLSDRSPGTPESYFTEVQITVFADGVPVQEGGTVRGKVEARFKVTHGKGQHAQFYGNFGVLYPRDGGSMIDSDPWVRSVEVDTSRFFDGENLISSHVHPHNVAGRPLNTDLAFCKFKIATDNGRPAPNGDRLLPTLNLPVRSDTWRPDARGGMAVGIAGLSDDVKPAGQVIAHLGSSVLGRWSALSGKADGFLGSDVAMVYFQREVPVTARIVFFFSDSVGRANYATQTIVIPPLAAATRETYPLPALDARILNVGQGDSITITDVEDFVVRVEVSNLPRLSSTAFGGPRLRLWAGNEIVAIAPLLPYIEKLKTGEKGFVVPMTIRLASLRELEKVSVGPGGSAKALWTDIRYEENGSLKNFPAADHVHLNSLRTGASLSRIEPAKGAVNGGTFVRLDGFGYFNSEVPTILFGDIPAERIENVTGQLRAYAPPAKAGGRVDVTVIKSNGAKASLPRAFNYEYPPFVVHSLEPSEGPYQGGTEAVILGDNFTPDTEIYFDGTPADRVTWVSPQQINLVVPYYSTKVLKPINKADVMVRRPDESFIELYGWYTYTSHDPTQTLRRTGNSAVSVLRDGAQ